jgi:hypothetical protein
MTTFADTGLTWAKETTYGTYVAGARGYEVQGDDLDHDYNKIPVQDMGLRVGSRFPRFARRVVVGRDGSMKIPKRIFSKGDGLFLEWALGTSLITLVSGSTNQHNFTTGDTPPSASIQAQLVEAGGTVDDYSWLGCMCDSIEFSLGNRDLLTATATVDARDLSTAQSHVAPVYATTPNLFHFANLSFSTGAFTAATANTLPSCATPMTNVRQMTLKLDRNLIKDRFNATANGLKGKSLVASPAVTGTIDLEYDSTTYRDAMIADTTLSLVAQYTAGALSTGLETFVFALPAIKLENPLPKANNDGLIVVSYNYSLGDDLTNTPFGIYQRTADAAL